MKKNCAALITAAGNSSRIGGTKKELLRLKDKTILYYSTLPFIKSGSCNNIFITCRPEDQAFFKDALRDLLQEKNIKFFFINGGKTRQESVYFGLKAMQDIIPEIVLIHDGARPFITEDIIQKVVSASETYGAAAPVVPLIDTVKVLENNFITSHPPRSELCAIQTPQGFIYKEIFEAHKKALEIEKNFTDDTEIYSILGKNVFAVDGKQENIKITYPEDLSRLQR